MPDIEATVNVSESSRVAILMWAEEQFAHDPLFQTPREMDYEYFLGLYKDTVFREFFWQPCPLEPDAIVSFVKNVLQQPKLRLTKDGWQVFDGVIRCLRSHFERLGTPSRAMTRRQARRGGKKFQRDFEKFHRSLAALDDPTKDWIGRTLAPLLEFVLTQQSVGTWGANSDLNGFLNLSRERDDEQGQYRPDWQIVIEDLPEPSAEKQGWSLFSNLMLRLEYQIKTMRLPEDSGGRLPVSSREHALDTVSMLYVGITDKAPPRGYGGGFQALTSDFFALVGEETDGLESAANSYLLR